MGTVVTLITKNQRRHEEAKTKALEYKVALLQEVESALGRVEYEYLNLRVKKAILKAQLFYAKTPLSGYFVDRVHDRVYVDQSELDQTISREFRVIFDEMMREIG